MEPPALYVVIFFIFILAGITQGSLGFGFAILSIPLISFVLPAKTAIVVVLILGLVTNLHLISKLRKHIDIRIALVPLLFSLAGRVFGTTLLISISVEAFRAMLGVFLIILSIYFLKGAKNIRIRPSFANGATAGILSGFLGGVFNISGPPLVIYYFSGIEDRYKYAACLQLTFVTGAIVSLVIHLLNGNVDTEVIKLSSVGVVAALAGGHIGIHIFKRIKKDALNKAIYIFLIIMGILLVLNV